MLTREEFYYTKIFNTSFPRCVGSFIQIGSTYYFLHAFKCVILCKIRNSVKLQTLNGCKKKFGVTIIDIFSSSLVILMSIIVLHFQLFIPMVKILRSKNSQKTRNFQYFQSAIFSSKLVKCFWNLYEVYAYAFLVFGKSFKSLASLLMELWLKN